IQSPGTAIGSKSRKLLNRSSKKVKKIVKATIISQLGLLMYALSNTFIRDIWWIWWCIAAHQGNIERGVD
ncbi:MAG: hypothetical protein QXD38_07945, partial [Ignisphaera sp.]